VIDPDDSELARVALDGERTVEEGISAIASLGSLNFARASKTLIEIGERSSESPEVLRATGHALARIFHAGVPISEFDMRNLAGPTYEAFCDWQA
jgi:hypothetical protein